MGLLQAARAGDLAVLLQLLTAGPPLRRARPNRMGAVDTAAQRRSRRPATQDCQVAQDMQDCQAAVGGTAADLTGFDFMSLAAAALVEATREGQVGAVRLLLDHGADPNWQGGGDAGGRWTAFHVGCWHDRAQCVDAIVRSGCNAGLRSRGGVVGGGGCGEDGGGGGGGVGGGGVTAGDNGHAKGNDYDNVAGSDVHRDERGAGLTGREMAERRGSVAVLALLSGPLAALKKERERTKVARRKRERRKRALLSEAVSRSGREGLFLEFGVASGTSIRFIASEIRRVHGGGSGSGNGGDGEGVSKGCGKGGRRGRGGKGGGKGRSDGSGKSGGKASGKVSDKVRGGGGTTTRLLPPPPVPTIHGFDSFEGLPEAWRDGCGPGMFSRDGAVPEVGPGVVLHVGWFDDTLPTFVREHIGTSATGGADVGCVVECDGEERSVATRNVEGKTTNAVDAVDVADVADVVDMADVAGMVGVLDGAAAIASDTDHDTTARPDASLPPSTPVSAMSESRCRSRRVSFVHVDCDLYSSTKTVLDLLAPGIGPGTILVFDDWAGYDGAAAHEERAWGEHCAQHGTRFEWIAPPVAAVIGQEADVSRALVVL